MLSITCSLSLSALVNYSGKTSTTHALTLAIVPSELERTDFRVVIGSCDPLRGIYDSCLTFNSSLASKNSLGTISILVVSVGMIW